MKLRLTEEQVEAYRTGDKGYSITAVGNLCADWLTLKAEVDRLSTIREPLIAAEMKRLRDALSELMLLQYGSEPENLDAVVTKYWRMRQDRLKLDAELSENPVESKQP